MQEQKLDAHHGRSIDIDLCHPCQSIWFDTRESPSLTPGSTLSLFRVIGENISRPAGSRADLAKCPRCRARLRRTHDMQRATRFEYLSCPHGHGRLTTFFDFLLEKHFIRPLTAEQIAELRRNIQSVNCSNCGGPIDLTHGAACGHCGSPVSMLDMQQAEALVAQLRTAADRTAQPVDPALPLEMARARREVEQAFAGLQGDEAWWRDVTESGLVGAGLSAIARWLKT
jgi:Zn-finger nucleic acid-binding protein